MKANRFNTLSDYAILLAVTLLAYWPLSLFICGVKGDAINYFLAMRFNSSEALHNGFFPSWSPYINLGYPLHADMQAGIWNPVALVLSLIRTYDIYMLQIETLLTIFISGISMHLLCGYFGMNRITRLSIAAAWMLNGYVTDAGQFLNWLYAAAYLPLVFYTALRCFSTFRTKDAFLLGASCSLLLLSAYPADVILTGYLLLAFMLFSFYHYQQQNTLKKGFIVFGKQLLISGGSFLLICLPALISYIPFLETFNRGSGISLELAMTNTLSPANLLSFIYPWTVQRIETGQLTDPLIRNCYMGILPLLFFILFFVRVKSKPPVSRFLVAVFIVFLLFSLGEAGAIRTISYYLLPLMDSFRHPANAKLFFLFAAQLLAAFAIDDYFKNPEKYKLSLSRISLFACSLTSLVVVIAFWFSRFSKSSGWLTSLKDRSSIKSLLSSFTFTDFLALNALLTAAVCFIIYRLSKNNRLRIFMPAVILFDMVIAAQLTLPLTSYRMASPAVTQAIQKAQPAGYPIPSLKMSLAENAADGMNYFDQIGCLNPYNKKPGRVDYIITPSNLKWQEEFWKYTGFRDKILQNPVAYLADSIWETKDSAAFVHYGNPNKAAMADIPQALLLNKPATSMDSIRLEKFSPAEFEITTWTGSPRLLVLLQNHYPNWEIFLNDEKVSPVPVNISFMGVRVGEGKSTVRFRYKSGLIKYMAIFSLLFSLSGLLYFSRKSIPSIEPQRN